MLYLTDHGLVLSDKFKTWGAEHTFAGVNISEVYVWETLHREAVSVSLCESLCTVPHVRLGSDLLIYY